MVIGEDEEESGRGGWGEKGEEEERGKEEQGFHLGEDGRLRWGRSREMFGGGNKGWREVVLAEFEKIW